MGTKMVNFTKPRREARDRFSLTALSGNLNPADPMISDFQPQICETILWCHHPERGREKEETKEHLC